MATQLMDKWGIPVPAALLERPERQCDHMVVACPRVSLGWPAWRRQEATMHIAAPGRKRRDSRRIKQQCYGIPCQPQPYDGPGMVAVGAVDEARKDLLQQDRPIQVAPRSDVRYISSLQRTSAKAIFGCRQRGRNHAVLGKCRGKATPLER